MNKIDLTLPTPAENLALDEALLDLAEEGKTGETLRFWDPQEYFVVLGYADSFSRSVIPECSYRESTGRSPIKDFGDDSLMIFRRCSGGGAVLQGPGCLNYALILKINGNVTEANRFVMEKHREAMEKILGREVAVQGHTDLAVDSKKFSGNSQRRKRTHFLFHGTFLLDFDLSMIEKTLAVPQKQPAYRKNRPHTDFLVNIGVPASEIKNALAETWGFPRPNTAGAETLPVRQAGAPLLQRVADLVQTRYANPEWNYKF